MSRTRKGSARCRNGKYFVRVTLRGNDRPSFELPRATNQRTADERAALVHLYAGWLRKVGALDLAPALLRKAASCDESRLPEVDESIGQLEGVATLRKATRGVIKQEKRAKSNRRYRKKYPEKEGAHNMVNGAIALGLLKHQPCEVCSDKRVIAHHDNYLPEHALDVRWLCRQHHGEQHRKGATTMNATPQEQARQATTIALATINDELEALDGWTIDNTEDNEFAAEMLQDVKQRHKALEAQRKTITKPLTAAKKAVDDLFRTPRGLLERAEVLLKGKIAVYVDTSEANTAALKEAANAETVEQAAAALSTIEHIEAPAGVSVRYKYRAIVFSPDIVPDEFRIPDEVAIQRYTDEAVKIHGEPTPIPGVRFDKEPIVTSRARGSK